MEKRRRGPVRATEPGYYLPPAERRASLVQSGSFHPSHLNPETYETLMMLYDTEMDLPTFVTFGDGSPVSAEVIREIHGTITKLAVANPWHQGDLLLLDNVLPATGECPTRVNEKCWFPRPDQRIPLPNPQA